MLLHLTELALLIALILGLFGGFIDNAFGMGYGIIAPILILLGFDPLIIVPILLLAQTVTGLSGTAFHHMFKNVNFRTRKTPLREADRYIIFTIAGVAGTAVAVIFAITVAEFFMLLYIGIMLILVGGFVRFKPDFRVTWHALYMISIIAGFNKALSGGGYGPLVTSGQIMTGTGVRNSVGVTIFSEATISAIGFLLYLIFGEFENLVRIVRLSIIMVVSGAIAAPFGALVVTKIDEELSKSVVGIIAIALGVFTLVGIFIF